LRLAAAATAAQNSRSKFSETQPKLHDECGCSLFVVTRTGPLHTAQKRPLFSPPHGGRGNSQSSRRIWTRAGNVSRVRTRRTARYHHHQFRNTKGAKPRRDKAMNPVELHRALGVQLCVTVVLLAYALAFYLNVRDAREHTQFFTERDPSLSYPNNSSTVPSWVLGITASVIPAVAVVAANLLRWRMHHASVDGRSGVAGGGGRAGGGGGVGGGSGGDTTAASASTSAHHTTPADADADADAESAQLSPRAATTTTTTKTPTAAAAARARARATSRRVAFYLCLFELFGMGQAIFVTMGSYNAVKAFVGRLRPNFFAACDYKGRGRGGVGSKR
jgi:hypothetical protein